MASQLAKSRALANLVFGAITLVYPLLALFLLKFFAPVWVVGALLVALVVRLIFGGPGAPVLMILASVAAITGLGLLAVFDPELAVRCYPVFMNAAMLVVFVSTLIHPPSMIEQFARLKEPDLPESGVRYTRRVTQVWCGFLAMNLAISLWTVLFASIEVWAIYNGAIAYVLMGLLFAGEYIVRRSRRAIAENPSGEQHL